MQGQADGELDARDPKELMGGHRSQQGDDIGGRGQLNEVRCSDYLAGHVHTLVVVGRTNHDPGSGDLCEPLLQKVCVFQAPRSHHELHPGARTGEVASRRTDELGRYRVLRRFTLWPHGHREQRDDRVGPRDLRPHFGDRSLQARVLGAR